MTNKEIKLYNICLEKVAQLLKYTYYWNVACLDNNPFNLLPSSIIDELVVRISHLSKSEPLLRSDLRHLIATGQIRNFKLEDIQVMYRDFMFILKYLSVSCQNLRLIKLKNVFWLNGYVDASQRKRKMKTKALECVFEKSLRLESVESCIEFNLKALRNCQYLKRLKLYFSPQCHLYDFLDESHGQFWPNNSLKGFEVFEDVRHYFSYLDVAVILKFCTELIEINYDISKSLEYLHAEELYNGTLRTKYKLRKCCLGSIYPDVREASVSRVGVYIASLTCPNLKEIDMLVKDASAVCVLREFSDLTSIRLRGQTVQDGNFTLGVHVVIQKIGTNLKTLHVVQFSNIDFSVIGINCPNLEDLRVEYASECNHYEFPLASFRKLISLHIENVDNGYCSTSSLIGLLSNCIDLKLLTLKPAEALTDSVLSDILRKNSLSKVRQARINDCALSSLGLKNLVSHFKRLQYLKISSSLLDFALAAYIALSLKPGIIIRSFKY